VWTALRTTPLPIDVIVTHILPRLHAEKIDVNFALQFVGQLDRTRAASVLGIQLPDSDDTASDASSVCKEEESAYMDSDFEEYPPSEWTASSSSEGEQDDPAEEGDARGNESADATSPNAKRVKEGE
jgi:hypothetical protein